MRKKEDYIIFLLLGGLLTFSLSFSVINATVIPVDFVKLALIVMGFLVFFMIVFYNQFTFFGFVALLAIGSLTIYVRKEMLLGGEAASKNIAYFSSVVFFVRGYLPYSEDLGATVLVFVCGFVSFYVTLALYVTFQFYFIAALGFGTFAINWVMRYKHSDLAFGLFLFCFCVLLFKKMNRKQPDSGLTALYMIPVCAVVVAVSQVLPAGQGKWDSPNAAQFLKEPLSKTNDFFYYIFNPKFFNFQTIGFTGRDGRLGGDLNLNNRYVMDVYADRRVYLAGLVRDTYTGRSWTNQDGAFSRPYSPEQAQAESIEARFAIPVIMESDERFISTVRDLSVHIGAARTGTLFRPPNNMGVSINLLPPRTLLTNDTFDLRVDDVLPTDTNYSYRYFDIDYTDEAVKAILRRAEKGAYQKTIDAALSALLSSSLSFENTSNAEDTSWMLGQDSSLLNDSAQTPLQYFQTVLAPYAQRVYERFTNVPGSVPRRVHDLAQEITDGQPTDYDKAKAIEEYLIQFPYTLTPGTPPTDQDFVDYFLFEGQKGYCTYYASAMAILSRCVGLPSRYVEGYVTPATPASPRHYVVTNMHAHSWAEIYLEGAGWVPFEATAPYGFNYNEENAPSGSGLFTPEFASNPDYEDYIRDMTGQYQSSDSFTITFAPLPTSQASSGSRGGWIWLAILGSFPIGLAVCLAAGRWRIDANLRGLKKLSAREQVIEYFKGILRMAHYCQYPIHENETPAAYAERIGKHFSFQDNSVLMRDLAPVYYRAKYAGDGYSDNLTDLNLMRNCYHELLVLIQRARPRHIFLWDRYVRRKI
ncbi:MAG: transglutaminase domain-containing protein [Clostridiales bacterium]|jgi:transglutaminase-like putative cysteine protease|nr:transglutaminase domain-containing protein [Clostridiales bacterium]